MILINTVNNQRFTLNGVEYLKNFISKVLGNKIIIYNAYENNDVLVDVVIFSEIQLNGVVYANATLLQQALLSVIYTRDSLNSVLTTLSFFNRYTNNTGFQFVGQNLTVNAGWAWEILNVPYSNVANVVINVPYAAAGKVRKDLIVSDQNNTHYRVAGAEVNTTNSPFEPALPINTLKLTSILVNDASFGQPTTPVVGENFIEKLEKDEEISAGSGAITYNITNKKAGYLINTGVTQINGCTVALSLNYYDGKKYFFKNNTSLNVTLKNNFAVSIPFIFPNAIDFVLKPNETIEFLLRQRTGLKMEYVGVISGGGSGIIDATAIAGTGNTVLKFDEIRYFGKTTQTGNISLSLDAVGNKNGRVQVIDIDGNSTGTFTPPVNSVNSNGVAFDNTKNNVIYFDFINGKVKFNITKQNLPDVTIPIYSTQNISNITPTTAKFNVKINEEGSVKWYLSLSNTTPSKATILAGTGAVGTNFGSLTTIANVETFANLTGLTLGVNYYLFSYAEDVAGNQTTIQTSLTFITAASVLASDNFNSANITNIVGRITPVGGYIWAKSGTGTTGTAGIVTNAFKNTGALLDIDNFYMLDVGRNIDISVTFNAVGTAGYSSLVIGYNTSGTMYFLTSALVLRKVVGGANSLVSNIAGSLVNGDIVRMVLTSTEITVFKNGVQIYTGASDPAVAGTSAGLYIYQDDVVAFDNLIIY